MIIRDVNLETVCGITSEIPDNPYDEVAFAGKSNVGKSSLINALMNRKALARTSSQPGKTQTINFYNINGEVYLVDLPGYGYASAGVEIKAKWGRMIENYLHTSSRLKAVFLLIDIRHEPSENDKMMYAWMLHQGFAPIIIATKLDKIKRSQVDRHIRVICDTLNVEPETVVIPFSAETKQGREEIWALIESLVKIPARAEKGKPAGTEGAGERKLPASEEMSEKEKPAGTKGAGEAGEGKPAGTKGAGERKLPASADNGKGKKERWKKAGRAPAKKTLRNRARQRQKHGKK